MKRLLQGLTALLLILALTVSLCGSCLAAEVQEHFTDVPRDAWYARAVYNLYLLRYMAGTGPNTFSPQVPMTRGMFVTVLYRIADDRNFHEHLDSYERIFLDTPETAWYFEAALWAARKGVAAGTSAKTFSPKQPISRQEAAAMLGRFLEQCDLPLPECEDCLDAVFPDAAEVSSYARAGVHLCWHMGLMDGYPDGCLHPKQTLTRAQAAVILENLLSLLCAGETPLPGCACVAWYGGEFNLFNSSGQALFDAEALGLEPMPYWSRSVVPDGESYLNVRDNDWLRAELQGAESVFMIRKDFYADLFSQSGVSSMTLAHDRQITLTGGEMDFQLSFPLYGSEPMNGAAQRHSRLTGSGVGEIGVSLDAADRIHVTGVDDGLCVALDGSHVWGLLNVRLTGLPADFWLRFGTAEDESLSLFIEDAAGDPIEGVVITELLYEP